MANDRQLPATRDSSKRLATPGTASLDWQGLWNGIKQFIARARTINTRIDEVTQTPADDAVIGKVGLVVARIADGKAGEIRLPVRGGTQDYIACLPADARTALDVNTTAEVVAFALPGTVFVRPVTPARSAAAEALNAELEHDDRPRFEPPPSTV